LNPETPTPATIGHPPDTAEGATWAATGNAPATNSAAKTSVVRLKFILFLLRRTVDRGELLRPAPG
jgi:hypothetical protein